MDTPSNNRLEDVFAGAAELPAGDRAAFLDVECAGQPELRAEVEELLRSYEASGIKLNPAILREISIQEKFARLKPEEAGERIGNYKLLEQIGEGGFGVVWVAEQERPVRRRVALKIIKLGMDTKEVIARFEQERQALAMMDHPNIAKVFDAGATPFGRPFFVMELVRGIKITDYCDQENLATTDRLELFIAVCNAVQHAHQKGIIHRDLKPSNILVTLHDGSPVPKVIDFGVAKATQSQRLTDLTVYTQFEQMIGTPLYMSPEQAEMSGLDIDTRSDIYSLGVLLYELLVGRTPFDPEYLMKQGLDEIRRTIREEEPPKPSTAMKTMAAEQQTKAARHRQADPARITKLLRGDLDWIVMKALEKDRIRRYETVNGLALDIRRHLEDEPVFARAPSFRYRTGKLIRRHIRVVSAAAAIILSLSVGLSAAAILYRREQAERRAANEHRLLAERRLEEVANVQLLLGRSLKRQNPIEAFRWLSTAALSGSPLAAQELESILLDGRSYSESANMVQILQAAADAGSAPAAAYLGECYIHGRGLEKDVDRGIKMIKRASEGGHLRAITVLGTCYQNGIGLPKDNIAAIRYYSQASERGDHDATGKLAEIYLDATSANINLQKGIDLVRKGTLAGNGFCIFQYARCCERGVGVEKDAAIAADLYQKAAKAGSEQAREWLFAQQGAVTWLGLTILDPTPQQMHDYGFKKDKVAPVVVQVRSNASLYTDPAYLGGLEGSAFWIVEHPALGTEFLSRGNHRSYSPKNTRELAEAILASIATPAEYKQLWRDYAALFSDQPEARDRVLKQANAIPDGEPGEYICRFVYEHPMHMGTLTTPIQLKESDLKELRAFLAK